MHKHEAQRSTIWNLIFLASTSFQSVHDSSESKKFPLPFKELREMNSRYIPILSNNFVFVSNFQTHRLLQDTCKP